jgi:hypothetical protein
MFYEVTRDIPQGMRLLEIWIKMKLDNLDFKSGFEETIKAIRNIGILRLQHENYREKGIQYLFIAVLLNIIMFPSLEQTFSCVYTIKQACPEFTNTDEFSYIAVLIAAISK